MSSCILRRVAHRVFAVAGAVVLPVGVTFAAGSEPKEAASSSIPVPVAIAYGLVWAIVPILVAVLARRLARVAKEVGDVERHLGARETRRG